MSEEPDKLKVVSAGASGKNRSSLPGLILLVSLAVVVGGFLFSGLPADHLWRSVGPGSGDYRACYELLKREFPNFDLLDVRSERIGDEWSFRFQIRQLHADNSPGSKTVRRCDTDAGTVAMDRF